MFDIKEKQNELIDSMVSKFVEKADDKRGLWTMLCLSLFGNFLIWTIVLSFPAKILLVAVLIGTFSSKLRNVLLLVPVASGFMSAYSIFRLKFPDIEANRNLASDVMASFYYQNHSAKRYAIWLLSMVAGVLNTILCLFLLRDTP